MLLVHGHGDTHRVWRPVLGRLAAQHEVFAVDLPGFGRSVALREPAAIAALVDAVTAFMHAQGHARFHVAGHSMGGAVALELAKTDVALTACAVSPVGFAEGWERALLEFSQRNARAMLSRIPLGLLRPAPVRRVVLAQYFARADRFPYDALALLARELSLSTAFAAYAPVIAAHTYGGSPRCPVTVAWGDRDALLLFRPQSRRARERLPDARHVTLRGCGHFPTWDDPEQVAEVILAATRSPRRPAPAAA